MLTAELSWQAQITNNRLVGVALWLLGGVAVFAGSRAIAPGRPAGLALELVIAILVSFAAGLAASARDFGGWAELDWRAGAFVIVSTFAAIGISRSIHLATRSVA